MGGRRRDGGRGGQTREMMDQMWKRNSFWPRKLLWWKCITSHENTIGKVKTRRQIFRFNDSPFGGLHMWLAFLIEMLNLTRQLVFYVLEANAMHPIRHVIWLDKIIIDGKMQSAECCRWSGLRSKVLAQTCSWHGWKYDAVLGIMRVDLRCCHPQRWNIKEGNLEANENVDFPTMKP